MNDIDLSERLKAVAAFLPQGANFADIGSDHAYLPCYVCTKDPKARAIAGEINQGPYQSAEKTVRERLLQDKVTVKKGNGLEVIEKGEVNQIVIAGMGGSLIASILESGKEKLTGVDRLILQPNVDAKSVRIWLEKNDYQLSMEKIIEEGGHIYEILSAEKSMNAIPMTEKELLFGPWLLREKSLPFKKKWVRELKKTDRILMEMEKAKNIDKNKKQQFEVEKKWIREVIDND